MVQGIRTKTIKKLETILSPYNYQYYTEAPGIFRDVAHQDYFTEFFMSMPTKSRNCGISMMGIGFYQVENYLLRNDNIPGYNVKNTRTRDYPSITLRLKGYEDIRRKKIENTSDLILFFNDIEKYLLEYAIPFTEKYNSLENVLNRINELHARGELWNKILDGGPYYLFRGLIISKMLDDPDYENKLAFVENRFKSQGKENWTASLKRMCEIIEDIQPQ